MFVALTYRHQHYGVLRPHRDRRGPFHTNNSLRLWPPSATAVAQHPLTVRVTPCKEVARLRQHA